MLEKELKELRDERIDKINNSGPAKWVSTDCKIIREFEPWNGFGHVKRSEKHNCKRKRL